MRLNKTTLQVAVATALAALGSSAIAGSFTGTNVGATASLYGTENFGAAAFIAADNFTLPAATTITFNTGSGASGGYVISPGGSVFIFFKLANATYAAAPVVGDFVVTGINNTGGVPLGAAAVAMSAPTADTVMLTVTNTTAFPAIIGTGSGVTFNIGASATANVLVPTAALRSAGAAVTVTGGISGVVPASANTMLTDIDSAPATNLATTATDISGSVAATSPATRIAVDAVNQRRTFLGGALVMNLGTITYTNSAATELQVDGVTPYTVTAPAGRTFDVTVTAGSGSFNAGATSATTVRVATDAACTTFVGVSALNVAGTSATITGVPVTTLPVYGCYSVTGLTQINEVSGITAVAALGQPAGGINDATLSVSGSLANVLNDGTVIDVRNYVPASANPFGYAMLLRVINTGNSTADIFGSFIDAAGTVGTQGTLSAAVPANGVVELTNTAIEAVLGAPTGAANPRLRVSAPTSSLSVQLWMRTNGTWVNVIGGQTNASGVSANSYDPSRQ